MGRHFGVLKRNVVRRNFHKKKYKGVDKMEEVKVGQMIKEIPNFSRYLANLSLGRVYIKPNGKKEGRYSYPKPNDIGYVYNSYTNDDGKSVVLGEHVMIMAAALETDPSDPFWLKMNLEIDHRSGKDKSDNRFKNLQLVTKGLNHQKIENRKPKSKKLDDETVLAIRAAFKDWVDSGLPKIQFYKNKANELGINAWQTIQYMCLGTTYTHLLKKEKAQ